MNTSWILSKIHLVHAGPINLDVKMLLFVCSQHVASVQNDIIAIHHDHTESILKVTQCHLIELILKMTFVRLLSKP